MCTSISILHLFIFECYKSDIFFISIRSSISIDKTRISIIVWERERERNPTKDLLRIEETLSALPDTASKMVAFRLTFWKRKKKKKEKCETFKRFWKWHKVRFGAPIRSSLPRAIARPTTFHSHHKKSTRYEKHRWSTLNSPLRGDQRVSRIARGTAATYCTEPVQSRALRDDRGRVEPTSAERRRARLNAATRVRG